MNPYQVLGIPGDADLDEVRYAFRKAALKYHPDVYQGDPAEGARRFQEINDAYQRVLRRFGKSTWQGGEVTPEVRVRRASVRDWRKGNGWWLERASMPWYQRVLTRRRTRATVNETAWFVFSWSGAIVLSVAVAVGLVRWEVPEHAGLAGGEGDALPVVLLAMVCYAVMVLFTLGAIRLTRRVAIWTVRWGLRAWRSLPAGSSRAASGSRQ